MCWGSRLMILALAIVVVLGDRGCADAGRADAGGHAAGHAEKIPTQQNYIKSFRIVGLLAAIEGLLRIELALIAAADLGQLI
jgi:hypothetical protein